MEKENTQKKYVSKIKMADNMIYEIKDKEAQAALNGETVIVLDCGSSTENI